MEENIFKTGSKKRAKDQEAVKAANNISEQIVETEQTEKTDLIEKNTTKVRVNFSLSPEANEKMKKKADEMGLSKSALLQYWIYENCE